MAVSGNRLNHCPSWAPACDSSCVTYEVNKASAIVAPPVGPARAVTCAGKAALAVSIGDIFGNVVALYGIAVPPDPTALVRRKSKSGEIVPVIAVPEICGVAHRPRISNSLPLPAALKMSKWSFAAAPADTLMKNEYVGSDCIRWP